MLAQFSDMMVEADGLAATRLGTILDLAEPERELLRLRLRGTVQTIKSRHELLRQGAVSHQVILLLEGWAAVSRTLYDGRRQTQAILLPGDFYDLDLFSTEEADHALTALGPLTYVALRRERLRYLAEECPRIGLSLWRHDLRAAALQREWIVRLGCGTALERISQLFCELHDRLDAIGRVDRGRCEMPLTQSDVAEATGLTPVHVNRTLQQLRAAKLIAFGRRELLIRDLPRLTRIAAFSADGVEERVARINFQLS